MQRKCLAGFAPQREHENQRIYSKRKVRLQRLEPGLFIQVFTKMEEDFPLFFFHGELVFAEEFLEMLLPDLCHNVFGFL